jgi:hypothetical protein
MRMKFKQFLAPVVGLLFVGCGGHPTDKTLRDRFFRKEATFNKLVQMAHQDPQMTRVAMDFTMPKEIQFSTLRWNEYRTLFRELGVSEGMSRLDRDEWVMFIVSASDSHDGRTMMGTVKGYVYSLKRPDPIVDSLDTLPASCFGEMAACLLFKPLKDDWYLYYERWWGIWD